MARGTAMDPLPVSSPSGHQAYVPHVTPDDDEIIVETPAATSTEDFSNTEKVKKDKKSKQKRESGGHCRCCTRFVGGMLCIALGVILIAVAIVYSTVVPSIVDDEVTNGVFLCDPSDYDKDSYTDAYGDCDDCVPFYYSLTMFNATNAEAYLNNGDKLQLQEVGPYVYRRREIKLDVKLSDDKKTISYKRYRYHTFDSGRSCDGCTEEDVIVNYDLGYLNVITQAGGERAFVLELIKGTFGPSMRGSEIVRTIESNGTDIMKWVNGLNSLEPEAMRNVGSDGRVLSFLTGGIDALAGITMEGFAYNGLFVRRTVHQWAIGYPSMLAGLGLGSTYVNDCQGDDGYDAKCESCQGDECDAIFANCNECKTGKNVVEMNNATCGRIEAIYAEAYGEEEAAAFAKGTCGLCEQVGLCAAPLPGAVSDDGMDYSKEAPDAASLNTYITRTGCDDPSMLGEYEQYDGFTSTPLWVKFGSRKDPTIIELRNFAGYSNCDNPPENLTCSAVKGNAGLGVPPGGVDLLGFGSDIPSSNNMYVIQAYQNVTLFEQEDTVKYKGITLHRFSPSEALLDGTEENMDMGTGTPVDGVQSMAFTSGFYAYVSFPMFLYGNSSLLDAIEITMTDGKVVSRDTMYNSGGKLKDEYSERYQTFMDIEAGTGQTMRAYNRLMASYALPKSNFIKGSSLSDLLHPNLTIDVIVPNYWGEENALISDDLSNYFKTIQMLVNSFLPVLIAGCAGGVLLIALGACCIVRHRRRKRAASNKGPKPEEHSP